MDRDRVRSVFQEQFYRTLAESGVEISSIPHGQLQALTAAVADGVFATLAALEEGEAPKPATASPEETVLWQGSPYLTLGTRYELTTQRLRIFKGIFSRQLEELDLIRVRDTRVKQHVGERALNIGDVSIMSTDPDNPEVTLHNVKDPMKLRELLRNAYLKEQERRGLRYREES
ncbi:MAG: PH domain-containing protein [Armatimonadetes bacterium]|nr:PH domain-containing protein [Armatimonadota bacterium]